MGKRKSSEHVFPEADFGISKLKMVLIEPEAVPLKDVV